MDESQKRQVAHKICVKDIIESKYFIEEGWQPNYIISNGKKISRVNLIGTIVSKTYGEDPSYKSIVIDDGTANIAVRSFDEIISNFNIGDMVLLIGKLREYGQEKYILPEIIKRVENKSWVELRKLELGTEGNEDLEFRKNEIKKEENEEILKPFNISEKVLTLVKELDSGSGADIQELISKSSIKEAENIIRILLEQGEIFEIRPGKLKILE